MYQPNEPSNCDFSDACRFIVDLRKSAENPFEHLNDDEYKVVLSDLVLSTRLIRENAELLDSLEHAELVEIVRSIHILGQKAKEVGRQ